MEPRRHEGATIHDKTRTKRGVRSVLFRLYHITVMSYKRKTNARNVVQEYLDRISASKKKSVKKAVPVEEPSSDDDTADRISPSTMPLKKRPAKKTVQEVEQLSDDGSSDSSPPNLEKFIFLNKS